MMPRSISSTRLRAAIVAIVLVILSASVVAEGTAQSGGARRQPGRQCSCGVVAVSR